MEALGPKFGGDLKGSGGRHRRPRVNTATWSNAGGKPFDLDVGGGAVTLEPADVVVQWVPEVGRGACRRRDAGAAGRAHPRTWLAKACSAMSFVRFRKLTARRRSGNGGCASRVSLASPDAELTAAIATYTSTIAAETPDRSLGPRDLGGELTRAEVKVDGKPLTVALRTVAR